jgi:hypothetical protein
MICAELDGLEEKLDLVLGGTGVLLSELVKPADPKSPFKGNCGLRKHVAWSMPVVITDVKAIGAPRTHPRGRRPRFCWREMASFNSG